MELNREPVIKALTMFIEDMPADLHLGFTRTVMFRNLLQDALALIVNKPRRGTMPEHQTIIPQKGGSLNDQERLEICRLLIKAGYTVKITTVKVGNTSARAIEYWR